MLRSLQGTTLGFKAYARPLPPFTLHMTVSNELEPGWPSKVSLSHGTQLPTAAPAPCLSFPV